MNGKTHEIGGVCSALLVSSAIMQTPYTSDKLILTGAMIGGSILGSLLPDIDMPESKMGRRFPILSHPIFKIFGHRGITHAPLIHILCSAVLLLLGSGFTGYPKLFYVTFVLGVFIGGLSHLLLDLLNVEGIPLLYPFCKKKQRIAKIHCSYNEITIKIVIIAITALILYFLK